MKSIIKKTFVNLGGTFILRNLNKTPRILFWHGVDNLVNKEVEAETFGVDTFRQQIKYLKKYFEVISIEDFYNRFKNNKFSNKEVVLTFDDGYANNLYKVAPILNEFSLPFTVFISTDHISNGELYPTSINRLIVLGSGIEKISIPSIGINNLNISTKQLKKRALSKISHELKTNELRVVKNITYDLKQNISGQEYLALTEKYSSVKPMNWDEVVKLKKMGATIGSHCKYHICCHKNQNIEIVRDQIIDSKRIIEEKLQTDCHYFAYPNGDYTEDSNSFVKEAGYKLGFSTDKNKKVSEYSNKTIIPRIGVPRNIDTFKMFINIYPKK